MTKKNFLILPLLLLAKTSFANCLFGDNLVEMARISDLEVSTEKVIQNNSVLDELIAKSIFRELETSNLSDSLRKSDTREFYWRTINSKSNNEKYNMLVFPAGDNFTGYIFDNLNGKTVATINDGLIENCKVNFTKYQSLPWFYTN